MAEERKTLDQRAQMSDIERLRHSAAHVLATAILRIWPEAQFAAGPPVETAITTTAGAEEGRCAGGGGMADDAVAGCAGNRAGDGAAAVAVSA